MTSILDVRREPVDRPESALIQASAGTGKTYSLSTLYLRMLLERGFAVPRILVVTYTNAATDELVMRIRARISDACRLLGGGADSAGDPVLSEICAPFLEHGREAAERRLRAALCEFDQAAISTIHGFCQKTLARHAFECGMPFDAEFIADDTPWVDLAARDFWRATVAGDALLAALSSAMGWSIEKCTGEYRHIHRQLDAVYCPRPDLVASRAAARDALDRFYHAWQTLETRWGDGEPELDWPAGWKWKKSRDGRIKSELVREFAREARLISSGADADHLVEALPSLMRLAWPSLRGAMTDAAARGAAMEDGPSVVARATEVCTVLASLGHALRHAFVEDVRARLAGTKERAGVLCFDDLLTRLKAALEDPAAGTALARAVAREYDAALIDEFQDTDPTQYAIFRLVFEAAHIPVFFIGDPKQAIYSFRGADIYTYMRAAQDTARKRSLGTNYRSGRGVVEAVNALFSVPRPFVFSGQLPFEPATAAREDVLDDAARPEFLHWWWYASEDGKPIPKREAGSMIPAHVAEETVRLLSSATLRTSDGTSRAVLPSDIAMLVRSKWQGELLQEALRERGVPSVIAGAGNIFGSRECGELRRILAAILAPQDAAVLRAALATECWGWTAREIAGLESDPGAVDTLAQRLEAYASSWARRGFIAMFDRFFAGERIGQRLLPLGDGERRMTNLRHLAGILQEVAHARALPPQALVDWLSAEDGTEERERAELRLETDADAVQIVTVHKSKGLEYGIVFCPFLWFSRQDMRRVDRPQEPCRYHGTVEGTDESRLILDFSDTPEPAAVALEKAETLAEELRLAYVALTRAKHRCYVAWGPFSKAEDSALAYLLCRPEVKAALPDAAWCEAVRQHAKDMLANGSAHGALMELVAANERLMRVDCLAEGSSDARWSRDADHVAEGAALRVPPASLPAGWRIETGTSSFTALVASAREIDQETPESEGLDHDAEDPHARPDGEDRIGASGADYGTCVHAVMEWLDFGRTDDASLRALIGSMLNRYAPMPEDRRGGVSDRTLAMIRAVLAAPLPQAGFRLSDVSPRERFDEMRFCLPAARFVPRALGALFAGADSFAGASDDTREHLRADSGAALAMLSPQDFQGFLVGSIDTVFRHAGRWYIIDWKTNLVPDPASPAALARIMCESRYVLQYHLYALALRRFLRHRLGAAWTPDAFGGVCYVFMRGVGDHGTGIFFDRPSGAFLDSLERLCLAPRDETGGKA